MQHDSHPVRIQVTEVHDGEVIDTIEEVTDGSCIPTGHVGQQPARWWAKVTPRTQVLNKEYGANRTVSAPQTPGYRLTPGFQLCDPQG